MSLPGFSAEASLFKASEHYPGGGSFPLLNKTIFPAQAGEPVDVVDIGSLDVTFPRVYGVVAGASMEERFAVCIKQCRASGRATFADCQRTCCLQLTGYENCYIA